MSEKREKIAEKRADGEGQKPSGEKLDGDLWVCRVLAAKTYAHHSAGLGVSRGGGNAEKGANAKHGRGCGVGGGA